MTFLDWWSKFRDDLHYPSETTRETLKRISETPPEYWTAKEWMLSRRQRFLRRQALDQARKKGLSISRVKAEFPEGPFWPDTPQFDPGFQISARDSRRRRERARRNNEQIYQEERLLYMGPVMDGGTLYYDHQLRMHVIKYD